jgi:hypothetical protein
MGSRRRKKKFIDRSASESGKALLEDVWNKRISYRRGQVGWSACYHTSVFIVPAASLVTTVLVAFKVAAVATTVVSATVTFMIAASTAGGFGRKWKNARTYRSRLDELIVDLEPINSMDDAQIAAVRTTFKGIIRAQDDAVLADGTTVSTA